MKDRKGSQTDDERIRSKVQRQLNAELGRLGLPPQQREQQQILTTLPIQQREYQPIQSKRKKSRGEPRQLETDAAGALRHAADRGAVERSADARGAYGRRLIGNIRGYRATVGGGGNGLVRLDSNFSPWDRE